MTGPQILSGMTVAFVLGLYLPAVWGWWRSRVTRRRPMSSMRVLRDEDFYATRARHNERDFPRCLPDPSPRRRESA